MVHYGREKTDGCTSHLNGPFHVARTIEAHFRKADNCHLPMSGHERPVRPRSRPPSDFLDRRLHFRLPLGSADYDHFIDAFLDMVESRGLMVGGMGEQLPLAETAGFVSALGGVPAEDDLQALVEWLLARHEVAHATIIPGSETDADVMGAEG